MTAPFNGFCTSKAPQCVEAAAILCDEEIMNLTFNSTLLELDDEIIDCDGGYDIKVEEFYYSFVWHNEGIGLIVVGIIGILTNLIAIPILCSKEFNTNFSRLLIALSIFDISFLGASIYEAIRTHLYSQ